MEDLLLLVHRIPYPPNKGDKVRSFHLLRYLNKHFKVHLACFIDDSVDWEYEHTLDSYCASRLVRPLHKGTRRFISLRGLLTGRALSLPYYADALMKRWVNKTIKRYKIRKVVVFSSVMAQFVPRDNDSIYTIMDFVDVDSDKWRQYAEAKTGLMKWIYKRESRKLEKYEKRVCKQFSRSYFVSRVEAELFKSLCEENKEKIDYYNNGVDYQFFNPALSFDNPFESGDRPVIVFSGAMDYWANIDAVTWFDEQVLHRIKTKIPNVVWYIVGSNPDAAVTKLSENTNVYVTGRVDDVRPYIKYATLIIAPMRIARGVQNKVLEAMSFNKPIVATQCALDGIETCAEFQLQACDSAETFADACIKIIQSPDIDIDYRKCVIQNYDWQRNLERLGLPLGITKNNANS